MAQGNSTTTSAEGSPLRAVQTTMSRTLREGAMYLALLWIGGQIWMGIGRRKRMRVIPSLGIAVIAAGGLHTLVDFSLQMPASAAFFAIILGLSYSQSVSPRT